MILLCRLELIGFYNTYLLFHERGGDAVVIDPGTTDSHLIKMLRDNQLYVRHIVTTHHLRTRTSGIRTLHRIYDFTHHRMRGLIRWSRVNKKTNKGGVLELGDTRVKVIPVGVEPKATVLLLIENYLFTGTVLSAGRIQVGETSPSPAESIRRVFEGMPDDTIILPAFGPPSTVRSELAFNPQLQRSGEGEA